MTPTSPTVAFLGPEGTYAHLTAIKRFGDRATLLPSPGIPEVFDTVARKKADLGIVPIENSSGGFIYETIDQLVDPKNQFRVQEALSINVRLALLGRDKKNIRIVYSHFAPLHHCQTWLSKHFPHAELVEQVTTGSAIQKAASTPNTAAIGSKSAAKRYGLKVLEYPIEQDIKNVTQFLVVGQNYSLVDDCEKTTIVFTLQNHSGSLYDFLTPFNENRVNLSKIVSRPIVGEPNAYVFLVDICGSQSQPNIKTALGKAQHLANSFKNLGSYPVRKTFDS